MAKRPTTASRSSGPSRVKFREVVKHQHFRFGKGEVVEFEDPDAAPYFMKAGWADASDASPSRTVSKEEIDIDPETIMGTGPNAGLKVADVEIQANG